MVALFGYSDESMYDKQMEQEGSGQLRNSNRMLTAERDRYVCNSGKIWLLQFLLLLESENINTSLLLGVCRKPTKPKTWTEPNRAVFQYFRPGSVQKSNNQIRSVRLLVFGCIKPTKAEPNRLVHLSYFYWFGVND